MIARAIKERNYIVVFPCFHCFTLISNQKNCTIMDIFEILEFRTKKF